MPSERKADLEKQKALGQLYCSDPNFKYCNDLREMEEQLRSGKSTPQL